MTDHLIIITGLSRWGDRGWRWTVRDEFGTRDECTSERGDGLYRWIGDSPMATQIIGNAQPPWSSTPKTAGGMRSKIRRWEEDRLGIARSDR